MSSNCRLILQSSFKSVIFLLSWSLHCKALHIRIGFRDILAASAAGEEIINTVYIATLLHTLALHIHYDCVVVISTAEDNKVDQNVTDELQRKLLNRKNNSGQGTIIIIKFIVRDSVYKIQIL